MRLTTVILIATLMQVSATSLAQKFTYSKQGASLEMIFKEIQNQTGYNVFYSTQNIDISKKLNVNFANEDLINVLKQCITDQNLQYSIDNKNIIIKPKTPSPFVIPNDRRNLFIDAVGRVLDESGKALEGASVVLKGTSRTVKTDAKGEFVIPNVPDDGVLVIRYVGYKQLEISLKDAVMPLEIKLNVATGELEEVNVTYSTGYQNIPKERATGSFVQIDNNLLNRSVSTNILTRLKGVVSGLNFETGPRPAGQYNRSDIMIRGNSTINANSTPLLVVDGFPYDESSGNTNLIQNINPNDIESITVLKDAAAASIWGARSGNGVIVIKTKKGKYNQSSNIQFNSNLTIGDKPNLEYIKTISSADAVAYERSRFADSLYNVNDDLYPTFGFYPILSPVAEILLARRRKSLTPQQAEERLLTLANHNIKDDISTYLLQKSINQQYSLNLSGGTNNFSYYTSIGYDKNRPVEIGNNNDRLSIRYDNTYRPIKQLELNAYIVFTKSKNAINAINYSGDLLGNAPYTTLADNDGNPLPIALPRNSIRTAYVDTLKIPALLNWQFRPLDEQRLNDNYSNSIDQRLGFGLKYNLISGLTTEFRYQYQKILTKQRKLYPIESYYVRNLVNRYTQIASNGTVTYPIPKAAIVDDSSLELTNQNLRGQINYNKSWGNHTLIVLAGAEIREVNSSSNYGTNYGYDLNTGLIARNIDYNTNYSLRPGGSTFASVPNNNQFGSTINRYLSQFANTAYTYKNKYTLSVSGRRDGSNFFGIKANQRITPLWSVGGLWDVTKEQFYRMSWLPTLKLRMTYGFNGNMYNSVTAYPTIKHQPPAPNFTPYAEVISPGNPSLAWEKINITNLALEFGTKDNRFNGSIEYYLKKGINLIGTILVEPTSGFKSYIGNRASIKGNGIDFTLNSKNIDGKVIWLSSLIFSYNTDKVVAYESSSQTAAGYIGGQPFVGKPLFSIFSYKWAGLNPVNGDPQAYVGNEVAQFSAVNSNAKPEDLSYSGSAIPKYFGSFRNTISYKQFSLSCNLIYKFGYFFRKSSINYSNLVTSWSGHADYGLRWIKPGDEVNTFVPSIPVTQNLTRDGVYMNSDILVRKGDHVRFQDIRFDFDLYKSNLDKSVLKNAKVYLYLNNIGVLWKANKDGIDPEVLDQTPRIPRTVSLGLNVNF